MGSREVGRITRVSRVSALAGEKTGAQSIVMQVLYRTRKDQRSSKKPVGESKEGEREQRCAHRQHWHASWSFPNPHIIMVANNAKRPAKSGTWNDRSLPTRLLPHLWVYESKTNTGSSRVSTMSYMLCPTGKPSLCSTVFLLSTTHSIVDLRALGGGSRKSHCTHGIWIMQIDGHQNTKCKAVRISDFRSLTTGD